VEALTSRLGTRFLVVTVVPNALLIAYVGFLVAAGEPARPPSASRALAVIDSLTTRQIIAILLGLLIISVATHPLQTPLVQFFEGYWWWLPEDEQGLLPTVLGNTLQTGEVLAGKRYGLETLDAFSRLAPLLSPASLADLRDRRNQLDAVIRLCATAGLATVLGLGLLLWHGQWLFLPLATYLVCWVCYRAAVAAASGYSNSLAAAFDLHHLRLFDALQLERPANLAEEVRRNELVGRLFGGFELEVDDMRRLRYTTPKTDGLEGK
jgi:hypothetical protein